MQETTQNVARSFFFQISIDIFSFSPIKPQKSTMKIIMTALKNLSHSLSFILLTYKSYHNLHSSRVNLMFKFLISSKIAAIFTYFVV